MLPELDRAAATGALTAGIRSLVDGGSPFAVRATGDAFVAAIAQHVAPAIVSVARRQLGVSFEIPAAVNLVVIRLGIEADHDTRRVLDETRSAVLPKILAANDPLNYLIRCATTIPDAGATRQSGRIPGWLVDELRAEAPASPQASLDRLVELGLQYAVDPIADEDDLADVAHWVKCRLLPETPLEAMHAVAEMVTWSMTAPPLVSRSHERDRSNAALSRTAQARALFPTLSAGQVDAVYSVLWGGLPDPAQTSLIGRALQVRAAHRGAEHDRTTILGVTLRDPHHLCTDCVNATLSGDQVRALAVTYATRMRRAAPLRGLRDRLPVAS